MSVSKHIGVPVVDMVEVKALSKNFGGPPVLDDVSFTLSRGHVHALIGPNGAGKTTLLNVLSGLYRPSAGAVFVEGQNLALKSGHELAAMGVARTFQNLKICGNLNVLENVLLGAHIRLQNSIMMGMLRLPAMVLRERHLIERARTVLDDVGLESRSQEMPETLPYGALKRLELARALMVEPKLLLLDEPAAGLNPSEKLDMGNQIERLVSKGMTVVMIEHDMKLVMRVSDNVVVLNYGRRIAQGPPSEIARHPEVIAAYLGVRASPTGATPAAVSSDSLTPS